VLHTFSPLLESDSAVLNLLPMALRGTGKKEWGGFPISDAKRDYD
jgi:hypothetical protein